MRPFPARGQRDQPLGGAAERVERHVRLLVHRAVEVRLRHQFAQIVVAGLVLGQQHQPVDRPRRPQIGGPGDRQQCADDRLHALVLGGVGEGHGRVEAVAVGDGDGGKAELLRLLGDRLRLDRPLEHAEAGKDSQGYERHGGHGADYGISRPRMEARPGHLSPS